jgi:NADPH:quinone reductase-like Zn-dependent oxidoreductase
MQAIRINQWGKPCEMEEIDQPIPASDEVLVRVYAASVNPLDSFVLAGYLQSMLTVPMTAGSDFAGEVMEVGAEVTHVKPGDAVYGFIPLRGGTFAECVITKGSEVTHKPQSLDFNDAAAVPLAALAAWQGLFSNAKLQSGERVLIHGVAGAVGSFAAQFAKLHGAYVVGTADAKDETFACELGIDEFINYQETPFETQVRDIDVVFAMVGGDVILRSFDVMNPGGRLVNARQLEHEEEGQRRGFQMTSLWTQPSPDDLNEIARLIDSGQVKVTITDTLPWSQAQNGLELSQQKGNQRRKVVLSMM